MRKSISKICLPLVFWVSASTCVRAQTGNPYFNVLDPHYGAVCDGSTDDTAAIQKALGEAKPSGGTVVIPDGKTCKIAGQLNMNQYVGVALVGGLAGSNKVRWGGTSSTGPKLQFTGSSSPLISALSSTGVSIDRLAIVATNSAFSGTVIDLSHDSTDTRCSGGPCDTDQFTLSNVGLDGSSTTASVLVSMDKTIESLVNNCIFWGGSVQIRGGSGSGSYSNINKILNSVFEGGSTVGTFIQNPSQGWVIQGNTFEVGTNPTQTIGVTSGFVAGGGIVFAGNWDGDMVGSNTFTKYTLTGSGWVIAGNHIEGNAPNTTVFSFPSWIADVTITGNNLCGNTFGTILSFGGTAYVDIDLRLCGNTTFSTFMSGTPTSGRIADDSGVKLYGSLTIYGPLSKPAGSFKIDHPLDPANKYLLHSFVESPDMLNIYNGIAKLDSHGRALIKLPAYFEALNQDFRYQLTPLGSFAPLYVLEKIKNNSFRIAGGRPGMEVSWQVTGIRHDAYANAHRIPVEEEKPPQEKGHYLYPELFRTPDSQAIQLSSKPSAKGLNPEEAGHN